MYILVGWFSLLWRLRFTHSSKCWLRA